MGDNYKNIIEFIDTLVIDFDKVVVLRGFVDGEDDYNYILQNLKGEFYQSSCVGEVIPLKGYIRESQYNRLKVQFQYNLEKLCEEIL